MAAPSAAPPVGTITRRLLLDLAMPLGAYVALTFTLLGDVARSPASVVARQFQAFRAEDYLGTVWFYWWTHGALSQGKPILHPDVVCAPEGIDLGRNFPNWVDAIMAWPFFHWLPFPANYNLFCTAIPVMGALAAYLALRGVTSQRGLALAGGALFGFNAYTFAEIVAGRPTTALLFVIPLFLACWMKALDTAGRRAWMWMAIAAPVTALVAYYHAIYALICLLFGAALATARLPWPAPGVSRWRPVLVVGLVGSVAAWLTTPYLYQITALQSRLSTPGPQNLTVPSQHMLPPWSPDLWRYLARLADLEWARWVNLGGPPDPHGNPLLEQQIWDGMVELSLPVDHLWREGMNLTDPSSMLYPAFLVAVLLVLAVAGGRRPLAWLALAVGFYLLTLGPWACWRVRPLPEFALLGGSRLRLPVWYLAHAVPATFTLLKPARFFPALLLALCLALTVALDVLPGRLASRWAWLQQRQTGARRAALLVAALLVGTALFRVSAAFSNTQFIVPFAPDPFLLQLSQEERGAIIELPVGLGHVLGGFQAVHGRPRSEGHHDEIAGLKAEMDALTSCYRLPLLQHLWHLGRIEHGQALAVPVGLQPALVQQAVAAGYGTLVVYLPAYRVLGEQGMNYDVQVVLDTLTDLLGEPAVADEWLVAWRLPGVTPPTSPDPAFPSRTPEG